MKKGLYRLSAKETEELKNQLHDLLENILYNPVQAHGVHSAYLSTKRMEDSVCA
jgi:phosphoribosylformylglycinamidine (FGAM) synthase PurS component